MKKFILVVHRSMRVPYNTVYYRPGEGVCAATERQDAHHFNSISEADIARSACNDYWKQNAQIDEVDV
jgi:hypothetical protein